MIVADLSQATSFLNEQGLFSAREHALDAFRKVQNRTCRGAEWLGWRRILSEPDDALLDRIDTHARRIRKEADLFIVCGIGGSYQGAKGILHALKTPFQQRKGEPEVLFAGHHLGGRYLSSLLEYMSVPKADGSPKEVFLNVISKSGTTLETAVAFRILREWMEERYGADAGRRIVATTSPKGGVLNELADAHGYEKYVIPDDVGGRFSVLTPVGLLPVAVAGLDSKTLFYGAVGMFESLEREPGNLLDYAAARYRFHGEGIALDLLSSFDPEWREMIGWLQQLLGESEGKEGKGLFPGVASYTTDLHSIGQMVQQGQRNLLETMIRTRRPMSELMIRASEARASHAEHGKASGETQDVLHRESKDALHAEEQDALDRESGRPARSSNDIDQLSYLEGKSLHEINHSAEEGTVRAHVEGNVPVVQIMVDAMGEQQLGEFIYFYELFTAVYGTMLGVNPFDQPGVEAYKKAMYHQLGKPF